MPVNDADYALVVGINHYPGFRPLKGAIEDAQDFAHWLTDKTQGGGLPDANCKLVVSEPSPLRPIQDDIDDKLQEIVVSLQAARGRRFYMYFSGHGLAQTQLGNDLCLAKWSELRRNMALDSQHYLQTVLGLGKFTEIVFLMDCCRVRKVNARGLPCTLSFPKPADEAGAVRSFIGYAAEFLNPAFESSVAEAAAAGGNPADVRGHFTRALLAALRGGAARTEGGVPAGRLKEYLEAETPRIAQQSGHAQKPEVVNGFPAAPEPLFGSAPPATMNVTIRFRAARAGEIVLEGPELQDIKRGPASGGPWRLRLDKGLYILREENATGEMSLRVRSGEELVDVEF